MKRFKKKIFAKCFENNEFGLPFCLAVGEVKFEYKYEHKELSAIDMHCYGIDSVILTEHENIESQVETIEEADDSDFQNGMGKKAMFESLHKRLLDENNYFNGNENQVNIQNQRWINFCDDCVKLAVLGHVVYEKPILLMHPNAFEATVDSNRDSWLMGADGLSPSLINGIEMFKQ